MQNERTESTKNGGVKRKIYTVWWDKEPVVIGKRTGLPVKDFYQTINKDAAERVAEARRQAGKKNVEITERWD